MKERIDVLMVQNGLAESREKAKALIMAGSVYIGEQRVDKPGTTIPDDAVIDVRGMHEFVSRGGLKLKKAMERYGIDLHGLVCADIGASTGGFTDCMLQNGAERVYAVDVGYGQLAWRLRNDPRVVNLERTNARTLSQQEIPEPLDFFSVDVAFISLKLILPALSALTKSGGECVCLIKPQFEAGRDKVGKKGVVRDPEVHKEVIQNVFGYLADNSFAVKALTFSPIKGPEGNIEYLVWATRTADNDGVPLCDIDGAAVVAEAHAALGKKEGSSD